MSPLADVQAIVRDALVQLELFQVPHVDGLVGKRFVKADHERLVLRANGPDADRGAVAEG